MAPLRHQSNGAWLRQVIALATPAGVELVEDFWFVSSIAFTRESAARATW
jgi:hypothetical protein